VNVEYQKQEVEKKQRTTRCACYTEDQCHPLTENSEFGQRAVADDVLSLLWVEMVEWHVRDTVLSLIVQYVMPMTERASLDVLSRQTHVNSVLQ